MYLERDAKIVLICGSLIGLVWFVSFLIVLTYYQQIHPNPNFNILQLMIFGLIIVLTAILIGSIYSLKKEITRQQEYLKTLPKTSAPMQKQDVQIPYNKMGLYSIIVASVVGIIAFLSLFVNFILGSQGIKNTNLGVVSTIILIFIIFFILILFASLLVLLKRIRVPLYDQVKPCPRCGSADVHKVEYSWWGGLIGPSLVHQTRCKKCGKTYNGVTGTDITNKVSIYIIAMIIISTILIILRYLI
jgi:uncharacterized membrane protein